MTTLSIQISDELARTIDRLANLLGKPKEELAAKLLEQQVTLVQSSSRSRMSVEEFEEIRRRLRPYAEAAGYTDEERILDDSS